MNSRWLLWTSIAFTGVIGIAMGCFSYFTKKVPWNYIGLICFTSFTSYAIANICTYVDTDTVIIAMGFSISVFLGLTVLSFFVRFCFKSISLNSSQPS